MIDGGVEQGQTLTTSTGTWSGNPTTFTYQWQRCNSGGAGCTDIEAATAQVHLLVANDVGWTLRVVVTAANSDGQATATSRQTVVVNAPAVVSLASDA